MSEIRWLVLRLDAGHLPRVPPAPWVSFPLVEKTLHNFRALATIGPAAELSQVLADFFGERGQHRRAQQAQALSRASTITLHELPDGLIFVTDEGMPEGHEVILESPKWDLARGVRCFAKMPQALLPVVEGYTHVHTGPAFSLEVWAQRGPFYETVCFDLSDLS